MNHVYEESILKPDPIVFTINSSNVMETSRSDERSQSKNISTVPSASRIFQYVVLLTILILTVVAVILGAINLAINSSIEADVKQAVEFNPLQTTTAPDAFSPCPVTTANNSPSFELGTFRNPAKSCSQLRSDGITNDGFYVIRPNSKVDPFKVYCDMNTSEGGWTLVATVNENNISRVCSSGDVWFSQETNEKTVLRAYRNWENKNVFGSAEQCTSVDYKNAAYFALQASDVMISHVPNHTPINEIVNGTFLQYHTDNQFLRDVGGNLYNMFNEHYVLEPNETVYVDVNSVLDSLVLRSAEIVGKITDFYHYDYGSSSSIINNGGENMFESYGARINVDVHRCSTYYPNYETDFKCPQTNSIYSSRKSYPFFALLWHENYDRSASYVQIRVQSYRPDSDLQLTYTKVISKGNFKLQYQSRCRYNMTSPSICDVMYVVTNEQDWRSTENIVLFPSYSRQTTTYYYYLYVREYSANFFAGYTLLSSSKGRLISETEVHNAMSVILDAFTQFPNILPRCQVNNPLVAPIQYSVGDASTVKAMIPPNLTNYETGFMQFRTYGRNGNVYAMCPAIKLNSGCLSEYACIGGVGRESHFDNDCNDFLDWNGVPGTTIQQSTPNGYAHSRRDIDSTIMIFYK